VLSGTLNGVVWSAEFDIFVIVTNGGVYTSSLKNRPPSNNNLFDSEFNSINESGEWTSKALTTTGNALIGGSLFLGDTNLTEDIDGHLTLGTTKRLTINGLTSSFVTTGEVNCDYLNTTFEGKFGNPNSNDELTLSGTQITFNSDSFISNTAGGNSGNHLVIYIYGTQYKIKLLERRKIPRECFKIISKCALNSLSDSSSSRGGRNYLWSPPPQGAPTASPLFPPCKSARARNTRAQARDNSNRPLSVEVPPLRDMVRK